MRNVLIQIPISVIGTKVYSYSYSMCIILLKKLLKFFFFSNNSP